MDDSVIVTSIEAQINDTIITTELKELEQSKQEYQKAVRTGHFAVHGSMKTEDLYTLKLGNVPARSFANITIRAVTELKPEGQAYRFILPTSITPRYSSYPEPEPTLPPFVEPSVPEKAGNFSILKNKLAMNFWNGESYASDWVGAAIQVASPLFEVYEPLVKKPAVFFVTPEGYLAYYRWSNGKYDLDDTSFRLLKVHKDGPIRPLYEPRRLATCIFVRGEDNKLHYVYWKDNRVVIDSETFEKLGGKLGHDFAVLFEPDRNHASLFYVSQNGLLYYFFLDGMYWRAETPFTVAGNVQGKITASLDPQTKRAKVSVRGQNRQMYHFVQKPDYSWTHEGTETSNGVTFSSNVKTKITLDMTLHMAKRITKVHSPTNAIEFAIENSKALFSGPIELEGNQDFVAIIETEQQHNRLWVNDNHGDIAAMAVFYPPLSEAPVSNPIDITFVLDRSGSMGHETMNAAKEAVQLFLRSLPVTCSFNIIAFDDSMEHLFPANQPFSETTFNQATEFVTNIHSRGGTELLSALKFAFAVPSASKKRIILLTDGAVENTDQVLSFVKQQNGIVYSLGIGNAVSTALVNGVARESHGHAEFIIPGEAIEPKVIRQLKRALSNGVMDSKVDWNVPITDLVFVSPAQVVYSPGDRIVSYAVIKSGTPIPKQAQLHVLFHDGTHQTFVADLTLILENTTMIHSLAAKKYIQEISDKTKIIETSIKYHVLSKYTGMIGVSKNVVTKQPTSVSTNIPVQYVKGWDSLRHSLHQAQNFRADRSIERDSYDGDIFHSYTPGRAAPRATDDATTILKPWLGTNTVQHVVSDHAIGNDNSGASMVPSSHQEKVNQMAYLDNDEEEADDEDQHQIGAGPPNELILNHIPEGPVSSNYVPKTTISPYSKMASTLVSLQLWNGTWALNAEFANVIGVPLQEMKHSCTNPSIFATAIAVQIITKESKGEYELVLVKASAVLQQDTCWSSDIATFMKTHLEK